MFIVSIKVCLSFSLESLVGGTYFVSFGTEISPLPLRSWYLKKVSPATSTAPNFFSLNNFLISSDLGTSRSLQLLGALCETRLLLAEKFHMSKDRCKKYEKTLDSSLVSRHHTQMQDFNHNVCLSSYY